MSVLVPACTGKKLCTVRKRVVIDILTRLVRLE